MSVGSQGRGDLGFPWIFIHDTDKVEGGRGPPGFSYMILIK